MAYAVDITKRTPGTTDWVLIPTNHALKGTGAAVMGAGLAKWAAERYPDLPMEYGFFLGSGTTADTGDADDAERALEAKAPYVAQKYRVICVATKHHWKEKASLSLIGTQLAYVRDVMVQVQQHQPGRVLVPRLGCGLGGLDWRRDVFPLLVRMGMHMPPYVICEP